jgi:hypothetical protein
LGLLGNGRIHPGPPQLDGGEAGGGCRGGPFEQRQLGEEDRQIDGVAVFGSAGGG